MYQSRLFGKRSKCGTETHFVGKAKRNSREMDEGLSISCLIVHHDGSVLLLNALVVVCLIHLATRLHGSK